MRHLLPRRGHWTPLREFLFELELVSLRGGKYILIAFRFATGGQGSLQPLRSLNPLLERFKILSLSTVCSFSAAELAQEDLPVPLGLADHSMVHRELLLSGGSRAEG